MKTSLTCFFSIFKNLKKQTIQIFHQAHLSLLLRVSIAFESGVLRVILVREDAKLSVKNHSKLANFLVMVAFKYHAFFF